VSAASDRPNLGHLIQVPKFLGHRSGLVHPIQGRTLSGDPITHDLLDGWTLLMFLSTSCDGCRQLWESVADPEHSQMPADLATLVITRDAQEASTDVARLCGTAAVVMSDEAWPDYGVHSGPFFVLVDGRQAKVATEGVAWSVEQITAAVGAARAV
jgi:hypothetical protein